MTFAEEQTRRISWPRVLIATWLVTAAWDFCCATALSVIAYQSTFARLWSGVASAAFGPGMLTAGARGVAAGIGLHAAVAFTWSAIFVACLFASPALRRIISRPAGAFASACAYGPIIWLVMSLVIIPTSTGRPPTISTRWWVQVF